MQALLLAAGQSKRFAPLPDKNFWRLGGEFLIEKAVANLRAAGARKIVIVANPTNEKQIRELFPKFEIVVQQKSADGMAGAVARRAEIFDRADGNFVDERPRRPARNSENFVRAKLRRRDFGAKSCGIFSRRIFENRGRANRRPSSKNRHRKKSPAIW